MSKYHAKPTVIDGIRFASKAEARRYCDLKLLESRGAIADLKTQVAYPIHVAGIPGPLNPRYDYRRSRLSRRNFTSFVGKRDGVGISTQAGRLYTWTGGATLASEARALRIIYDHSDDARHTDYSIFGHPIAERIHGRVSYNGAVFVREDLRKARDELNGVHLAQVISPLSRLAALYLFDVDWCIATTKAKLFLNGTAERYGWAGIYGGVDQHIEGIGGERDHYLMWSRREDMLAEAERIVREGIKPPND